MGLLTLRMTDVYRLLPDEAPQVWVRSGCTAADAAVRAALRSSPERPIYLVPLDQTSDIAKSACHSTLTALHSDGYVWLQLLPEPWLCQRLADTASEYGSTRAPAVPMFYLDGEIICEGLCEGAFESIGRPEVQQYVTLFKPQSQDTDERQDATKSPRFSAERLQSLEEPSTEGQ